MYRLMLFALLVSLPAPLSLRAEEPVDSREYWVYEGGWLALLPGGNWYEVNEETHRLGKPWNFREVRRTKQFIEVRDERRTKQFIEVRDERRGVNLRLTETDLEARWDKNYPDAEWKSLYKGRWKKRG